jgi:hypothetical protein
MYSHAYLLYSRRKSLCSDEKCRCPKRCVQDSAHNMFFNEGNVIIRTWRKLVTTKHPYTWFGMISTTQLILVNFVLHITDNFVKLQKIITAQSHKQKRI